jgi:hypothetical protein
MKKNIEKLIEDYGRRIETAKNEIKKCKLKELEKENRLSTKISAWRTFIAELNQIIQND